MAECVYKPLDATRREIRLVRILPRIESSDFSAVECILKHFSLDSPPDYVATSYVWGHSTHSEQIIVNGHAISKTGNLEGTLRRLRDLQSRTEPRIDHWWIDGLCINQDDKDEKSSQVKQMHAIYKSAACVFVSLTPTAYLDEYGIQTLRIIYDEIEDMNFVGCSAENLSAEQEAYLYNFFSRLTFNTSEDPHSMPFFASNSDLAKQTGSNDGSRPSTTHQIPIQYLSAFFGHIWWTRVWILQEVAVSKESYFCCGTEFIHCMAVVSIFYMLQALFQLLTKRHAGDALYTSWANMVIWPAVKFSSAVIHAWRHTALLEEGLSLFSFLLGHIETKLLESSDPRDKVFAVLGLANDTTDHGIVADYSQSSQAVFTKVTRAMVEKQGLEVLKFCSGVDADVEPGSRIAAPSWIPAWFVQRSKIRDNDGMEGSRYIDRSSSHSEEISRSEAVLTLTGHFHDQVETTGNVLDELLRIELADEDSISERMEIMSRWLLEIKGHYDSLPQGLPGTGTEDTIADGQPFSRRSHQAVERSLWQTPIMGADIQDDEADVLEFGYHILTGSIEPPADVDAGQWRAQRSQLYRHYMKNACGKAWFFTSNRYLGLGRPSISPGDRVFVFRNSDTPFVVRCGEDANFRLVGPADIFEHVHSKPVGAQVTISLS